MSNAEHGIFRVINTSLIASKGTNAPIVVQRQYGTQNEVDVDWQVFPAGTMATLPLSGTVAFPDGVTVASITVTIVQDGIPELEKNATLPLMATHTAVDLAGIDPRAPAATSTTKEQQREWPLWGCTGIVDACRECIDWTPHIHDSA